MNTINILIADDHQIFAEGLESVLNQTEGIRIVGIARDGNHLLSLLKTKTPDIVLLDISMPELNGYDTATQLLRYYPSVKIIILTMHNTEEYIIPMVKLGVHGYILKNAGKTEVLKSIYSVLNTGQYFNEEISKKIKGRKELLNNIKLSSRELEILQLIFEGLSTQKISERLFISPRTVETHRKNMLSKTVSVNAAQLIHYALENNLLSKMNDKHGII
jgi:two-component system response regulator DegU